MFDEVAIRHGVYVTGAYIALFNVFIVCQVVSYKRVFLAYRARGEKVSWGRYYQERFPAPFFSFFPFFLPRIFQNFENEQAQFLPTVFLPKPCWRFFSIFPT